MALSSVLRTALTGMSAATARIDFASHNLANMQTDGFKSSYPAFASQFVATYSFGSEPNAWSGGSNPVQIGTGVELAGVVVDESAGSLVIGPNGELIELSNTDVGENLVELILSADQFAANAEVFNVAGNLLDELVLLRR
jgi:flagellar hook protein FlgE